MKLVINDRIKHRLIGGIVLVSLGLIFLPALVKKSNYSFDEKVNVSVRLPSKPHSPDIMAPGEKNMFRAIKTAHVELAPIEESPQLLQTVKAEPISNLATVNQGTTLVKPEWVKRAALSHARVPKSTLHLAEKKIIKEIYAVQLASFARQNNAENLVSRLRSKGYKASYSKFSGKQGEFYKVLVGQLNQKEEAKLLQKKLAESLQLNGFVVKTGVS